MAIDNFGHWFPDNNHEGFNNPHALPPVPRNAGEADARRLELRNFALRRNIEAAAVGQRRRVDIEAAARIDIEGFNNPLAMPEREHNRNWLTQYKQLDISKMKEVDVYSRGVSLPPFKVNYDSYEQINQKLTNTVILVKGWPFTVSGIISRESGFALLLTDVQGEHRWLDFKDITCLRSLAPGYVNYHQQAYWVYRLPTRQVSQGLTHHNTFMRPAGDGTRASGAQERVLLEVLQNRKNVPFQPNLISLIENNIITSVRLSNNLALHRTTTNGAAAGVEYVGRPLGLIIQNRLKLLDEADLGPTWIQQDCAEIELELF